MPVAGGRRRPARTIGGDRVRPDECSLIPYVLYHDEPAAVDWLVRVLGFEQTHRHDSSGQVELRLGNCLLMTGAPRSGYRSPSELGGHTQYVVLMVDDVDAHYAAARAAGQTAFHEEPHDEPYGERRYAVDDPEGHRWYVAGPLRR
jgi:uncharacterized glyoxalase superfamily protein PhnB